MLKLDLSPELEEVLESFAAKAGLSKAALARQAIVTYLEDLEDSSLAQQAIDEGGEPIPLAEIMKNYGVDERA
jgi:predicted DNA-binding protein